jgi:hypothetical protein
MDRGKGDVLKVGDQAERVYLDAMKYIHYGGDLKYMFSKADVFESYTRSMTPEHKWHHNETSSRKHCEK